MRLLVDTSAYSAFMRGHGEIKAALQEADEIFVNSIVLGELRAGFIKGRRRKNDDELNTFSRFTPSEASRCNRRNR